VEKIATVPAFCAHRISRPVTYIPRLDGKRKQN